MWTSREPVPPQGRCVLVTGASSGLGRQATVELARHGFTVFAAVRRDADGAQLRQAATGTGTVRPVLLDVTDDATLQRAAEEITAETGAAGLWGLVNNAGICITAPLECVTREQLRTQLETNVVGSVMVTRAMLPALRRCGGRIVNVTSGLGTVAVPYLGAYAASQFAKEALSDIMRRELRAFGISVSVVQPGAIMTPIWRKTRETALRTLQAAPESVAGLYRSSLLSFVDANEQGALASTTTMQDFADAVRTALTAHRPKIRYVVGADVKKARFMTRLLPASAFDRQLGAIVGPPPAVGREPASTSPGR